ncbi:c-type cytochrome [uncultured Thiohalocapsa sp.]|uniref:c-type cytochrome n=1 Tax=uncultured Thiohalocapsa sp. TaxID=768990 RepID=UPI0025EFDB13|nr:c-type cytochrome [uncultured Thiohalocapsa sp.]
MTNSFADHLQTLGRRGALLLGIALLSAPALTAADDDGFVWNRAMLDIIESGDVERGRQIAEDKRCSKCHGDLGIPEDDETPSIAGQVAAYQFKQLVDYKAKVRDARSMYKVARRLELQDFADLAAYFATLEPEPPEGKTAPPLLVTQGDTDRLLLPCNVCHGEQGEGMGLQVPALSGQKIDHFIETMVAYRDGERANDDFGRMRFIASQLSEEEITTLAAYYAAAPVPGDE